MYQNRKYVLETKRVLAGAERLKDLDFWVPPDVGSAHPASRVLYCVTDSHAARGAAIASLFDRCFLTVRTCPPTPIEKFRHAARTHDTTQTVVRDDLNSGHRNDIRKSKEPMKADSPHIVGSVVVLS